MLSFVGTHDLHHLFSFFRESVGMAKRGFGTLRETAGVDFSVHNVGAALYQVHLVHVAKLDNLGTFFERERNSQ